MWPVTSQSPLSSLPRSRRQVGLESSTQRAVHQPLIFHPPTLPFSPRRSPIFFNPFLFCLGLRASASLAPFIRCISDPSYSYQLVGYHMLQVLSSPTRPLQLASDNVLEARAVARAEQCSALLPITLRYATLHNRCSRSLATHMLWLWVQVSLTTRHTKTWYQETYK